MRRIYASFGKKKKDSLGSLASNILLQESQYESPYTDITYVNFKRNKHCTTPVMLRYTAYQMTHGHGVVVFCFVVVYHQPPPL